MRFISCTIPSTSIHSNTNDRFIQKWNTTETPTDVHYKNLDQILHWCKVDSRDCADNEHHIWCQQLLFIEATMKLYAAIMRFKTTIANFCI